MHPAAPPATQRGGDRRRDRRARLLSTRHRRSSGARRARRSFAARLRTRDDVRPPGRTRARRAIGLVAPRAAQTMLRFPTRDRGGIALPVAFALDCCDREAMSFLATTGGIAGEDVRDLMVTAVGRPRAPVRRARPHIAVERKRNPHRAAQRIYFRTMRGLASLTGHDVRLHRRMPFCAPTPRWPTERVAGGKQLTLLQFPRAIPFD
jgi:hypothetical protein